MTDDPRAVLKAAGVECAEVEAWVEKVFTGEFSEMKTASDAMSIIGPLREVVVTSNDAVLTLARLVAKYKWQREIQVVGALDYNGAIARLDELWESHLREQHNA